MSFSKNVEDLSVLTNLTYTVSPDDNLVNLIRVGTQALRQTGNGYEAVYDAPAYHEILRLHSISKLMSAYGIPSRIVLSMEIISAEPTSPDLFRLWLLYPERGVIARYSGTAEVTGDTIRGCPSKTFVDLWLLPTGDTVLYQETLTELTDRWEGLKPASPYFKLIEEASGMTTEEFYKLFREPIDRCFETPLGIWPAH
jgi:hypothetical protein